MDSKAKAKIIEWVCKTYNHKKHEWQHEIKAIDDQIKDLENKKTLLQIKARRDLNHFAENECESKGLILSTLYKILKENENR